MLISNVDACKNKINTYHSFEDVEDMEHLNIDHPLQNLDVFDLVMGPVK